MKYFTWKYVDEEKKNSVRLTLVGEKDQVTILHPNYIVAYKGLNDCVTGEWEKHLKGFLVKKSDFLKYKIVGNSKPQSQIYISTSTASEIHVKHMSHVKKWVFCRCSNILFHTPGIELDFQKPYWAALFKKEIDFIRVIIKCRENTEDEKIGFYTEGTLKTVNLLKDEHIWVNPSHLVAYSDKIEDMEDIQVRKYGDKKTRYTQKPMIMLKGERTVFLQTSSFAEDFRHAFKGERGGIIKRGLKKYVPFGDLLID